MEAQQSFLKYWTFSEYDGRIFRFDSGGIHNSGPPTSFDEFDAGQVTRKTFFDVLERAKFLNSLEQKKVIKSAWWMPWLSEAMKDVISCDKLRGSANNCYIRRFPNGATRLREAESIPIYRDGKPGELKHLSTRRKRKQ